MRYLLAFLALAALAAPAAAQYGRPPLVSTQSSFGCNGGGGGFYASPFGNGGGMPYANGGGFPYANGNGYGQQQLVYGGRPPQQFAGNGFGQPQFREPYGFPIVPPPLPDRTELTAYRNGLRIRFEIRPQPYYQPLYPPPPGGFYAGGPQPYQGGFCPPGCGP
jgi:hypothetical protein